MDFTVAEDNEGSNLADAFKQKMQSLENKLAQRGDKQKQKVTKREFTKEELLERQKELKKAARKNAAQLNFINTCETNDNTPMSGRGVDKSVASKLLNRLA